MASPDSSRQTSTSPISSQSPVHSGNSLAAAAAVNSALRHSQSEASEEPPATPLSTVTSDFSNASTESEANGLERRRSSIRIRLANMDPTLPAPGELAMSPGARQRAPSLSAGNATTSSSHSRHQSLSELHQEAEYEQEAQFNRLRSIIRAQQAHLDALTSETSAAAINNGSAIEDTPNGSNLPSGENTPGHVMHPNTSTIPVRSSPHTNQSNQGGHARAGYPRSHESSSVIASSPVAPFAATPPFPAVEDDFLSHRSSTTGLALGLSHTTSSSSSLRDEANYYQAETSVYIRENQMLRRRIRELEGQLTSLEGSEFHRSHLRETSAT